MNINERQVTINWLTSLNLPVLPIAPAQSAEPHPALNKDGSVKNDKQGNPQPTFTGKNPSFISASGKLQLVNHRKYQNQLPSASEQEQWFANPVNGIGTLGGWNNYIYLDFDVKNFGGDKEACQSAAFRIAANYLQVSGKEPFLQESHSGGWHVGVRVKQDPGFTNFALSPGGKHIGEALGKGRFIVMAPTIGVSGNSYKIHQWGDPSGEIETLESLGIYSSKAMKDKPFTLPVLNAVPSFIPLSALLSKANQAILNGDCPSGDRSADIATLLNESYGWVNWANDNGITISGSPEELAHQAGASLGLDLERIQRIIKTIDVIACTPAASFKGSEESCWKKIFRLDRASFEAKCPAHIKDAIKAEWRRSQVASVREAATGRLISENSSQQATTSKVICAKFGGSSNSGSGNGGSGDKPDWQEIYKLVEELINKGLTSVQLSAALLDLSVKTQLPLNGLKDIAKEIEHDLSRSIGLEDEEEELSKLLEYQNQNLDLHQILPESFAKPLLTKSNSDRTDPLFMYMNFITAVGTKLGAHIGIMGKEGSTINDAWIEFAIIWTLIISPPSGGKSQSQSAIFNPLKRNQDKARRRFKEQIKELEKLKTAWQSKNYQEKEKAENTLENPQKFEEQIVRPRIEIIDDGTLEAILKRVSENPAKSGTTLGYDEIIQLIAIDQYKKVGDSLPRLMKTWSKPSTAEIQRADDKNSILLNHQTLCFTGGIQPAKVRTLLSDPDDGDGFGSRFLMGTSKTPDNFDIWSSEKVSIDQFLDTTYRNLDNLPSELREKAGLPKLDEDNNPTTVVVKFSPKAEKAWQNWWEKIRRLQKKMESENPAFSGYLGKALSQLLRVALVLHSLSVIAGEEENPLEVSERTFQRALYAIRWHIGQFRLLQSRTDDQGLSGILLKIHEYAERKAGKEISAEQIQKTLFRRAERKPKLQEIRENMKLLAAWGKATIIGVGSKLRLVVNKIKDVVIPTSYDKNYDNPSEAETPTIVCVQEFTQESYDNYDNSSTPQFLDDDTTTDVWADIENQRLSRADSEQIEDFNSEDCRNCRNSEGEDTSIPYVEALSDDSDLSENVSENGRNYDNPSSDEPDDDPDPDNDPPDVGSNLIACTADDEPVFEGSLAVVEAEEAPEEWKGQILWSVIRAVSNSFYPNETWVECKSQPNVGTKTMRLSWLKPLTPEQATIHLQRVKVIEAETTALKRKRIQHKEFTGTLIEKVRSGWHVLWDVSKSTRNRFGNPPELLQDGDFEFI
jgi:hypothetical protein